MQQTPFEQLAGELTPLYGAGEARSIARIVLEDAFQARPATALPAIPPEQAERWAQLRGALLSGVPVQYALGMADFFGWKFRVTPAVLIPRQETEELVAWALDLLRTAPAGARVLDIGVGSGCIGIAIAGKRKDLAVSGLEKSPEALALALENADRLLGPGKVDFQAGDILTGHHGFKGPFDLIVSNPPYIPRSETHLIPQHVLEHEPALALFVEGADPLLFYRAIAQFAQKNLSPTGRLLFECNEFNAPAVGQMLEAAGFQDIALRKDLGVADRMIACRL